MRGVFFIALGYTYHIRMLISEPSAIFFSNLWDATWWFLIPLFLFPLFIKMWLFYVRKYYITNLKWVNLQVSVPIEVLKTPKAMEQIFAAAHGTFSHGIKWYDKWWNGEVENWSSFEIMADSSGPRFYIRVVAGVQKMLEAAIYSQYPDAEIMLAEDYTAKFPLVLPNAMYDLHSGDFILTHDDTLPIRTYEYFEAKEADEKIDTIGTLMEALFSNFIKASFLKEDEELEWPEDKKGEKIKIMDLTPGKKLQLEAIDMKLSKLMFETVIRWTHINRKEELNLANTSGIRAWVKQFADENLNILRPYLPTYTVTAKWPFKKRKQFIKKRLQYENSIKRRFPKKFSMMNTEELATIYHFPSATVKTPMLGRVEAKKGTPPASLPVE